MHYEEKGLREILLIRNIYLNRKYYEKKFRYNIKIQIKIN